MGVGVIMDERMCLIVILKDGPQKLIKLEVKCQLKFPLSIHLKTE